MALITTCDDVWRGLLFSFFELIVLVLEATDFAVLGDESTENQSLKSVFLTEVPSVKPVMLARLKTGLGPVKPLFVWQFEPVDQYSFFISE